MRDWFIRIWKRKRAQDRALSLIVPPLLVGGVGVFIMVRGYWDDLGTVGLLFGGALVLLGLYLWLALRRLDREARMLE